MFFRFLCYFSVLFCLKFRAEERVNEKVAVRWAHLLDVSELKLELRVVVAEWVDIVESEVYDLNNSGTALNSPWARVLPITAFVLCAWLLLQFSTIWLFSHPIRLFLNLLWGGDTVICGPPILRENQVVGMCDVFGEWELEEGDGTLQSGMGSPGHSSLVHLISIHCDSPNERDKSYHAISVFFMLLWHASLISSATFMPARWGIDNDVSHTPIHNMQFSATSNVLFLCLWIALTVTVDLHIHWPANFKVGLVQFSFLI